MSGDARVVTIPVKFPPEAPPMTQPTLLKLLDDEAMFRERMADTYVGAAHDRHVQAAMAIRAAAQRLREEMERARKRVTEAVKDPRRYKWEAWTFVLASAERINGSSPLPLPTPTAPTRAGRDKHGVCDFCGAVGPIESVPGQRGIAGFASCQRCSTHCDLCGDATKLADGLSCDECGRRNPVTR